MNAPSKAAAVATHSGVLLIGHGTRDPLGTEQFFQLAAELRQTLAENLGGDVPVQPSLLEFQQPTIPQGWQQLTRCGVTHIHAAPLLLFAAGHAKEDIPDALRQCQGQTPQIGLSHVRPLSRHPAIIELAMQRLNASLSHCQADAQSTAVVMVGRGSRDACASADMRVLSEILTRRAAVARVETAFYAMASPRAVDVIERVAATGRYETIVVHPHLLFQGRLYDAICKQAQQAAEKYPQIRFATSRYLGPHRLVAEAIASRCGYS